MNIVMVAGFTGVIAWFTYVAFVLAALGVASLLITWLLGVRYIPHNKVGIVEKLWSPSGSVVMISASSLSSL